MKRTTLIPVFLFIVILLAFAGNDLTITYSRQKSARVISALVDTGSVAYGFTVRQEKSGLFTLEAPPFLVADLDGRIRIGEIRDSGLFSLMLNPMSGTDYRNGFRPGGNFRDIEHPSIHPRMSGIVFSYPHADIIVLSPVFNPQSPLGFGVLAGTRNAFAGFLTAGQNEKTMESENGKYQVNWQQLGTGRHMFFTLLGTSAQAVIGPFTADGQIFIRNAWDLYLGGGTTTGWELSLSSDLMTIRGSEKLGGTGVKLKTLSDDDVPMDSLHLEAQLSSADRTGPELDVKYSSDTYRVPVYGGNSQKRDVSYSIGVKYWLLTMKAVSSTMYETDRGKTSCTDYSVSMEMEDFKVQAGFTLNRPTDGKQEATDGELKISTPRATLDITTERTELEMNWIMYLDGAVFKASVNQDRQVSASLKFTGI